MMKDTETPYPEIPRLPPPKKRLVSKSKYVAHLAELAYLTTCGVGLLILGSAITIGLLMYAVFSLVMSSWIVGLSCLVLVLLPGCLAFAGITVVKAAQSMQPLAPITRHNAAQLPSAESLVRPSSLHAVPPEQILLRPTTATAETPADILLRPHG